eukprot:CAMPEP_0115026688 /NCGR_PEP_ID=MMETSP0216-20121206/34925_1 /TAXON_ID=223996 /ORGANISM="Protocruzia adherens, Strain Boccale" /LENGTH=161 /DNA_ID=CAMNT_0002401871 /DNA_START=44 /DNA_END=529 /DNA_ORIENTATION=+
MDSQDIPTTTNLLAKTPEVSSNTNGKSVMSYTADSGFSTSGGVQSQFSVKRKMQSVEEQIQGVNEEITFYKKEVQKMRAEKEALNTQIETNSVDLQKVMDQELTRLKERMLGEFATQTSERSKLQQQVSGLKGEKSALLEQITGVQNRISEIQNQIGEEQG